MYPWHTQCVSQVQTQGADTHSGPSHCTYSSSTTYSLLICSPKSFSSHQCLCFGWSWELRSLACFFFWSKNGLCTLCRASGLTRSNNFLSPDTWHQLCLLSSSVFFSVQIFFLKIRKRQEKSWKGAGRWQKEKQTIWHFWVCNPQRWHEWKRPVQQ